MIDYAQAGARWRIRDNQIMDEQGDRIAGDLHEAKERLIARGIASASAFCGCTSSEIRRVESEAGHPLPRAYVEFLKQMGKGAGRFFGGTDIFYPFMFDNAAAAKEMLEELANGLVLPKNCFVFAMHQGYQFFFFFDDSDNPSVHYYMEGNDQFEQWNDSFSEFITQMAANDW